MSAAEMRSVLKGSAWMSLPLLLLCDLIFHWPAISHLFAARIASGQRISPEIDGIYFVAHIFGIAVGSAISPNVSGLCDRLNTHEQAKPSPV
jgi:hypothetical protein